MSRIPELLRELADEIEQKEIQDDINFVTINTQLRESLTIAHNNKDKIKEVANAFSSFANILGRED